MTDAATRGWAARARETLMEVGYEDVGRGGLEVSGLGRLTGDARIVYCRAKFAMLMTLLLALTVMERIGLPGTIRTTVDPS